MQVLYSASATHSCCVRMRWLPLLHRHGCPLTTPAATTTQCMELQLSPARLLPSLPPHRRNGKGTCFAYGQTGSGKTFTMAPLPMRAAQVSRCTVLLLPLLVLLPAVPMLWPWLQWSSVRRRRAGGAME